MARFVCFGEVLLRYSWSKDDGTSPEVPAHDEAQGWEVAVVGAELNVAVALAKLGWPGPLLVTVAADGALGDRLVDLTRKAFAPNGSDVSLHLRRCSGGVGAVYCWLAGGRKVYRRDKSAFTQQKADWFDEPFWESLLQERGTHSEVTVLHLSGLPALLSTPSSQAWANALAAAGRLRAQGKPLIVTLELTPRKEIGGYLELWMHTVPQLHNLDVLVLSLNILAPLGTLLGAGDVDVISRLDALRPALAGLDAVAAQRLPPGLGSVEAVDALLAGTLRDLRRLVLGDRVQPTFLLTVKLLEPTAHKAEQSATARCRQRRWSVACTREHVISTARTAVCHEPLTSDGGTDAWLAGVIDVLQATVSGLAAEAQPFALDVSPMEWATALQAGDCLAALKQDQSRFGSDVSSVGRTEWDEALAAKGVTLRSHQGHSGPPSKRARQTSSDTGNLAERYWEGVDDFDGAA